jgi:hypothetical protein
MINIQGLRVICSILRRSMKTISHYFKKMFFAVGELIGEMIKPPSGRTSLKIKNS